MRLSKYCASLLGGLQKAPKRAVAGVVWVASWLLSWWFCPNVAKSEESKAAKELFKKPYHPGAKYSDVLPYATSVYQEAVESFDLVDAKAEKVAGFSSASAVALYAALRATNSKIDWYFVGAYACFVVSMVLIFRLRSPLKISRPVSVPTLLEELSPPHQGVDADLELRRVDEDQQARERVVSYHVATVETRKAIAWKRTQFGRANFFLLVAYGLILASLIDLAGASQRSP